MNLPMSVPFQVQVDQLFNEAVRNLERSSMSGWVPAANVWEDHEQFCIELSLPGWKIQDLSVQVENNYLTVTGTVPEAEQATQQKRVYQIYEWEPRSFLRSFEIPTRFNCEDPQASLSQGMLRILFSVREEAKPRKIMIQ